MDKKRRMYGQHLTPVDIFKKYILPEIKNYIYKYRWVDLFAGEGNLILPILETIPKKERINFFKNHIFLFDVQKEMVDKCIKNAINYGISKEIAEKNIVVKDTLKDYPKFILDSKLPIYHITNPPYLYIGYIKKHKETQKYLKYFEGENEGYQDLYQLALMNDLRNKINNMIYIIPSNFLFGSSGTNKIRDDFLKYYYIKKGIIFEKEIFKHTGVNVAILFFKRKSKPKNEMLSFEGLKINHSLKKRNYILNPKNHYRAGNEFDEFVNNYKAKNPLKIKYYLTIEEVEKNKGNNYLAVIDANNFNGKSYEKLKINVNYECYNKIKSNNLWIRTVDTGSNDGRAGIYLINESFKTDGILVTKAKYRTHPIQIFIEPILSKDEQTILKDYFNIILEYFRDKTDSEFLTTYKYSNSEYTRKYLGLTQAKKLIETFPLLDLNKDQRGEFINIIKYSDTNRLLEFVKSLKNNEGIKKWL